MLRWSNANWQFCPLSCIAWNGQTVFVSSGKNEICLLSLLVSIHKVCHCRKVRRWIFLPCTLFHVFFLLYCFPVYFSFRDWDLFSPHVLLRGWDEWFLLSPRSTAEVGMNGGVLFAIPSSPLAHSITDVMAWARASSLSSLFPGLLSAPFRSPVLSSETYGSLGAKGTYCCEPPELFSYSSGWAGHFASSLRGKVFRKPPSPLARGEGSFVVSSPFQLPASRVLQSPSTIAMCTPFPHIELWTFKQTIYR